MSCCVVCVSVPFVCIVFVFEVGLIRCVCFVVLLSLFVCWFAFFVCRIFLLSVVFRFCVFVCVDVASHFH